MPRVQWTNAFITGASSGIGRELALRLAEKGVSLALVARREERLRALSLEIEALGSKALVLPCDVADPNALDAALAEAKEAFGFIDLVIANAGIGEEHSASNPDRSARDAMIAVNLSAALNTIYAFLPEMIAQGRGQIVGVASMAGWRGYPQSNIYCATKAGLIRGLEGLRAEVKRKGISVTTVCPGFVKTPMTDRNDFPMPFMISAEKASRVMLRGMARGQRLIEFPWPMKQLMRMVRLLPGWLLDALMSGRSDLYRKKPVD